MTNNLLNIIEREHHAITITNRNNLLRVSILSVLKNYKDFNQELSSKNSKIKDCVQQKHNYRHLVWLFTLKINNNSTQYLKC